MHIPAISNLAPWLLPLLSPHVYEPLSPPSQASTVTSGQRLFQPIHAIGHTHSNTSSPRLILHNATSTHSLQSSLESFSALSTPEEMETYLLDHPHPSIAAQPLSIRTKTVTIRRPKIAPPTILSWAISAQHKRSLAAASSLHPSQGYKDADGNWVGWNSSTWSAPEYDDHNGWEDVEVTAPDVSDRQTLITMAKMASNAYVLPDGGEWWPVKGYNHSLPFGYEPDADGLRGHVFADDTNSTVIIAIKGTSAGLLGSGGPSAKNDKYNDNLLFSCCCARVDFSWSTVCDCYAGGYKCNEQCLEDSVIADSVYSTVGTNLYNNVTYMYPNATIWLVGHSLGGSVAAMIGLSFGAPAVTFEAVGDHLPSGRLHLPLPPGIAANLTGITHVYHTADPIPMGTCTGGYSGCYAAGFALEAKCHTGQTILYDTVTVKGWSVDIRTHRIGEIINKVLVDPWPGAEDAKGDRSGKVSMTGMELDAGKRRWTNWWGWGRRGPKKGDKSGDDDDDDGGWERHGGVPKPEAEEGCVDCYRWEFGEYEKK